MKYECIACGETYERELNGTYYCDWVDCDSEDALEPIKQQNE